MLQTLADPQSTRCVQVEVLWVLSAVTAGSTGRPLALWSPKKPPGPEVLAIVPVLTTLTRHDDAEVRLTALGMLVSIDPEAGEAPAKYFAYLRDARKEDQDLESQWVYRILRPVMIPELIAGLNDGDPEIRLATAQAMSRMANGLAQAAAQDQANTAKPTAARSEVAARRRRLKVQAARALLSTVKDPDDRVRWVAAETLGVLKVEAETVLPILIGMAMREKQLVVTEDPVEIRTFEGEGQDYHLGPSRPRKDPLRIAAIQALGSFGAEAGPAVPELVRALHDPDLRVRWFAAEALARIGPAAKSAVPALIEALRSRDVAPAAADGEGMEDGPIRLMAAVALGKIGADALRRRPGPDEGPVRPRLPSARGGHSSRRCDWPRCCRCGPRVDSADDSQPR